MFSDSEITDVLRALAITHVVWLPDSALGPWERAFESAADLRLIRVCREAEAWGIAAGLHLGGQRPIIIIQSTGFFEGSDAMRNFLFDFKFPLLAMVGYRSFNMADSPDSAKYFLEPIIKAWGLEYVLLKGSGDLSLLQQHFFRCLSEGRPGLALVAEGKG